MTHAHFPSRRASDRCSTDPDERAFFDASGRGARAERAYGHVQATRPDTLAAALNDSPAGLSPGSPRSSSSGATPRRATRCRRAPHLARSDPHGGDDLLGHPVHRHARSGPYYEGADQPDSIPPVEVPAAVFIQRHEGTYPESLARSYYRDLRVFERLAEGGHFAVGEVPAAMAERTRSFARALGLL